MEKNINYENLKIMVNEDDIDFYEKFLSDLSETEFENFMNENPEFFTE